MIGLVQPDRWTCPSCGVTEVPDVAVAVAALPAAIREVQTVHGREHVAERARAALLEHYERRGWISVEELLSSYRPGSRGPDWSWDDETRELLAFACLCASSPPDEFVRCATPGHYQLMLEEHLRRLGRIEQPICLGNDGRVWDGHHRVVAAIRLGFDRIPVETSNASGG